MGEHLRYLARHARLGLSCMPNAGLPVLERDGASYPLTPEELAEAHDVFTAEHGLALVGGCCGTTPAHLRLVVERVRGRELAPRRPRPEPGAASLYQTVAFRQDTSYLAVGERTNANGSRVFRDAMLEGRFEDCVEVARDATRDGSHLHRRVRRLRGSRRRCRHARDRRPVRDGVDLADHARLHRAAGHRSWA